MAETAEKTSAIRTIACPACQAAKHENCTTPTENGRREVGWLHYARKDAYYGLP